MGDWIAFVLLQQDPLGKTREIRSATDVLEMEVETLLMGVIITVK